MERVDSGLWIPAVSGRDCGDCAVRPGELHELWCDVELCPYCGGQAIQCWSSHTCPGCETEFIETECGEYLKNDDRMPWTGEWPGDAECREFGWYSKFVTGQGWVRCEKDDPQASEDLNRLHMGEAVWSRELKRYVLRRPIHDARDRPGDPGGDDDDE